MTVYKLETELNFGKKHRGETIEEIIEDDPDYLFWALDAIEWFELDDEAEEELEKSASNANRSIGPDFNSFYKGGPNDRLLNKQ